MSVEFLYNDSRYHGERIDSLDNFVDLIKVGDKDYWFVPKNILTEINDGSEIKTPINKRLIIAAAKTILETYNYELEKNKISKENYPILGLKFSI